MSWAERERMDAVCGRRGGETCVFFVDLRDAIEEWCAGFVGVFGKV